TPRRGNNNFVMIFFVIGKAANLKWDIIAAIDLRLLTKRADTTRPIPSHCFEIVVFNTRAPQAPQKTHRNI
ncbi:MAG: hypothetical protein LUP98_04540, partial [Methylococcaceae bacterium]|nr:hypothetical protein [Methylococcaceae bacterium]